MAISANIVNNGNAVTIKLYGLLPVEKVNIQWLEPILSGGCTYSQQVIIKTLPGAGAVLKTVAGASVSVDDTVDASVFPGAYLEITGPVFGTVYSLTFQYVGSCGESNIGTYSVQYFENDGISVPQFTVGNFAKGQIVPDVVFPDPSTAGVCDFVSYQLESLPPATSAVFKKNGVVMTTGTTFTNADTISLEIAVNAPLGSHDLRYRANGACQVSYNAQYTFFIADAPGYPSMLTQTPLYIGEPISGNISADGDLLVFRNGVQVQASAYSAGFWSFIPTVAGEYWFKLRNQFGTSGQSLTTVVIDPSAVIPPAPSIDTISPTSVNVPIIVNVKSSGTLRIFKDSVEIGTKNVTFGNNQYVATAAGNYQFKIQNSTGLSPISSQIVVNSSALSQTPTFNPVDSDLQLPSAYVNFTALEDGHLEIYNSDNVLLANVVRTAGQTWSHTVTVPSLIYAVMNATGKNKSAKTALIEVKGAILAAPVITSPAQIVVGAAIVLTIPVDGTLIPFRNGNALASVVVTAGTYNYTPAISGAYNFKLQNGSGISDYTTTTNVVLAGTGGPGSVSVVFVGAFSSCGDILEYGFHPSSDDPADVALWSLSNVITVPSEGSYYFFARSTTDNTKYWVSFVNTAGLEIGTDSGGGSGEIGEMKIFTGVYSFTEGQPKQVSFGSGIEISFYTVEMRDTAGNAVLMPIPPATRLNTGFIIAPDITISDVTVRAAGI